MGGAGLLANVTLGDFERFLESRFLIHVEGGTVPALLIKAVAAPESRGPEGCREPFSLMFRCEGEAPAGQQGQCDLEFPEGGVVPGVLVTRVAPPSGLPGGAYLQVSFN